MGVEGAVELGFSKELAEVRSGSGGSSGGGRRRTSSTSSSSSGC